MLTLMDPHPCACLNIRIDNSGTRVLMCKFYSALICDLHSSSCNLACMALLTFKEKLLKPVAIVARRAVSVDWKLTRACHTQQSRLFVLAANSSIQQIVYAFLYNFIRSTCSTINHGAKASVHSLTTAPIISLRPCRLPKAKGNMRANKHSRCCKVIQLALSLSETRACDLGFQSFQRMLSPFCLADSWGLQFRSY